MAIAHSPFTYLSSKPFDNFLFRFEKENKLPHSLHLKNHFVLLKAGGSCQIAMSHAFILETMKLLQLQFSSFNFKIPHHTIQIKIKDNIANYKYKWLYKLESC